MLQALSGLVRTAFPPNAQENRRQKVIKEVVTQEKSWRAT